MSCSASDRPEPCLAPESCSCLDVDFWRCQQPGLHSTRWPSGLPGRPLLTTSHSCSQSHATANALYLLCSVFHHACVVLQQSDGMCTSFVCCYSRFDYYLTSTCLLQSALSGKRTTSKLQTVLRDVSKVKSMALLLRTVVAADVQGLVQPSLSSHRRYGLRLLLHCTVVLTGQIKMSSSSMPFVAGDACILWDAPLPE